MLDHVIDALAVARLTRLWTEDAFPPVQAARQRAYAAVQARHGHVWAEGLTSCPWCVSAYAGAFVVLARRFGGAPWRATARALAFSMVTGLLADKA